MQSAGKEAIDRGQTADKVRGFDPGAAPLDTDDEAAGLPPQGRIDLVRGPAPSSATMFAADPAGNDRSDYRRQDRVIWPAVVGTLVLVAVAVIMLWQFAF